jgi:shikimate kinase
MKIFLIGMMGAGKTHLMKLLSKKLKVGGYDLDALIEAMDERTVSEIFAQDGEESFRKQESKMLKLFGEKKAFVLASGGGTPCFFDNMKWMNKQGITIWLDEPIDVLVERLIPEKAHRPLIANFSSEELKTYLEKKSEERKEFYEQATIKLSGKDVDEVKLAKRLKEEMSKREELVS